MKWIVILVGGVVLALAAVVGVGQFMLPNVLTIAQSVQIDRHRSMVYPLVANLANFQEWSPWTRLDPNQDYAVTGSAGPGQSAAFKSASVQVGEGVWRISAAEPNRTVTFALEGGALGAGAQTVSLALAMEDASGGAATTWTLTRTCGSNWDAIVCRYGNLFMEAPARAAMEQGLNRLKQLVEDLPALDISDVVVTIENRSPRPYAYVETSATRDSEMRVANVLMRGLDEVRVFINDNRLVSNGARVAVMTRDDGQQVFMNAGYLIEGSTQALGAPPVRIGDTPGGRAAMMVHNGSPAKMKTSYAQFLAYLRAHRIEWYGQPWEIYTRPATREDEADAQVEIYLPVR